MQFDRLQRREFVTLLGGAAAAWPLAAQAQPATPVIGFIYSASPAPIAHRLQLFRQGLKEAGYVEGENAAIVYRFAEGQNDRLPELLADLRRRQVTVIAAMSTAAAVAAKAATTAIPIVFVVAEDPVGLGLVTSLARPDGNVTGINFFVGELTAKRLELLREVVAAAARVAVLVDPDNKAGTESTLRDVEPAARAMGLQIQVVRAGTVRDIDAAFAELVRARADALFVGPSPLFAGRRIHITNLADAWRQVGVYSGRVLKGARPADLPVVQASKFELVINHQTARTLGLTVPPMLLARADEVIE